MGGHLIHSQNHSKAAMRRELRASRHHLSSHTRSIFDEAIRQHLRQLIKSRQARSIACFWPFNGEPDIVPLCQQLMADGCECALPVISGKNDHAMQFHSWQSDTTLTKNRYGILEPQTSALIPVDRFDLLIMPLVGYDRHGNRLGMGSGYYDRHLESLRNLHTPLRVGVAYSLQETESLDENDWDIPLHGVVNERGWFTFVES